MDVCTGYVVRVDSYFFYDLFQYLVKKTSDRSTRLVFLGVSYWRGVFALGFFPLFVAIMKMTEAVHE